MVVSNCPASTSAAGALSWTAEPESAFPSDSDSSASVRSASPAPSAIFSISPSRRGTDLTIPDDCKGVEDTHGFKALLSPAKRTLLAGHAEVENPVAEAKKKEMGKVKSFLRQRVLRIKLVVPPHPEVYYFPLRTDGPLKCAVQKEYKKRLSFQHDVVLHARLIKCLDAPNPMLARTFLAALPEASQYEQHGKLASFLVVKAYPKFLPDNEHLSYVSSMSAVRQHVRVFRRLACLTEKATRYILLADAIAQDALHSYIVMPVMRSSLFDVFNKPSENQICLRKFTFIWMAQLISAVTTLHNVGIIHRNITPDHIMIDHDGIIKLTDFSRAYVDSSEKPLVAGMSYAYRSFGTIQYMAPEVRNMLKKDDVILEHGKLDYDEKIGGLKGYGKESDVWSLGCVFAELMRARKRGPKEHQMLFPLAEKDIRVCTPYAHDKYQILSADRHYEFYAKTSPRMQYNFLDQYDVGNMFDLNFIWKFLQVDPYARIKLEDAAKDKYFTLGASNYDAYLNSVLRKDLRPDFEVKFDLRAESTHECDISYTAAKPNGVAVQIGAHQTEIR